MKRIMFVVVLVAAILLLTSCGKDDSTDKGDFDRTALQVTSHDLSCSEIRSGEKINPVMIRDGCVGPDGALVLFAVLGFDNCEFTTYDDRFYGEIGGVWHEAAQGSTEGDKRYSQAYRECAGK